MMAEHDTRDRPREPRIQAPTVDALALLDGIVALDTFPYTARSLLASVCLRDY